MSRNAGERMKAKADAGEIGAGLSGYERQRIRQSVASSSLQLPGARDDAYCPALAGAAAPVVADSHAG